MADLTEFEKLIKEYGGTTSVAPPTQNIANVTSDAAPTGVVAGATIPTNTYTKQFGGQDYTLGTDIIDLLTQQILSQNTTSKWSGEGFGSAEANARAMAENLAASGITNINQVAQKKIITPGFTQYGESGDTEVPESSYDQIINKVTGQQLVNDYGERGGVDNAWSGTYTGKGNTAYRVQFDDKGNPYFYTTGASSNDIVNFLGDDPILNAIAQIGATYIGGPAGNAALNAAMGKAPKDIAKSYILSQLGQEAFKGLTDTGIETNTFGEAGANFAKDIKDVFGKTGSEVLGKTAGQYVAGEGKVDLGSLLVNQGVGAATNAVIGEIPGYNDLSLTQKTLVNKIVTATLNDGKLSPNEAINAALSAGTQAAKSTGRTGLTPEEQQEFEDVRLKKIKNTVLNQPASDDGTTQGVLDLINEMFPAADIKGMSQADLSKFLEANMEEIQGSADLDTLLKGNQSATKDDGVVTVTGDRPKGNVTLADTPEELIITGERPTSNLNSLRTREIKSDIPDELTIDDIDKLFPDIDYNDILQTVVADTTKTAPPIKTVVPAKKTTQPGTKTTDQTLANLGLNDSMSSQDPYANIKLMEELFGGDTAYKLRALGAPQNLASTDLDALARLLRG